MPTPPPDQPVQQPNRSTSILSWKENWPSRGRQRSAPWLNKRARPMTWLPDQRPKRQRRQESWNVRANIRRHYRLTIDNSHVISHHLEAITMLRHIVVGIMLSAII